MSVVGIHCILELYECPADVLNDAEMIARSLQQAAHCAQLTVLDQILHQFTPQGITALALLSESHISIHTWPEIGYAAVDIFTCGDQAQPENACQFLASAFQAERYSLQTLSRQPPIKACSG